MDYDELLKLAEYCLKIEDIPSLFIISHLLVNFHLGAYENKITIYRSFRNLVVLKIYAGKVGPDPRHLEEMFNTSFSILLKKKIIVLQNRELKINPKDIQFCSVYVVKLKRVKEEAGTNTMWGKKKRYLMCVFEDLISSE